MESDDFNDTMTCLEETRARELALRGVVLVFEESEGKGGVTES